MSKRKLYIFLKEDVEGIPFTGENVRPIESTAETFNIEINEEAEQELHELGLSLTEYETRPRAFETSNRYRNKGNI